MQRLPFWSAACITRSIVPGLLEPIGHFDIAATCKRKSAPFTLPQAIAAAPQGQGNFQLTALTASNGERNGGRERFCG